MRVLLLGGGGREHALGWKLAQSPLLDTLISAPGNPGLAGLGRIEPDLDPTDPDAVTAFAVAEKIDLVVVGPEAPLAAGVVDALTRAGVAAFGPGVAGAQLEASKAFSKEVMRQAGIPTAAARSFTDADAAAAYLDTAPAPYVVKADGLAAGKGVLVTEDLVAATAWARHCLEGGFGDAGSTVVIEEHLEGREVSIFAICDGSHAIPLAPARDYKRLGDADTGPNTGGMGCYSPVDDLPDDLVADTMRNIVSPVLTVMAERHEPYVGFLYVGLMLTADGPKVLEFNTRLGDPETQVVLPRLDHDLLALLVDAASGRLGNRDLEWKDQAAVNVVLATPGYPMAPKTGASITGLDALADRADVLIFHAGTANGNGGVVTSGGRVLSAVGLGPDIATARRIAYEAAATIEFKGKQTRGDIAS